MTLLPIHIVSGSIGIVSGFTALFALKGAWLHRRSGIVFVFAMLVLASTGATMAVLKPNAGNIMGGALAFYLVTTGALTIRRPAGAFDGKDVAALLLGLAIAIAGLMFGLDAAHSVKGAKDGYPPALYFIFGSVALLGAVGDARMMRAGAIHGVTRIVRHLWRMCLALFVAAGSFFLGQAQVFPKAIRIMPLLAIPALLPLALLLFWLARTRLTQRYPSRV